MCAEALDSARVESLWRSQQAQESRGCQTKAVHTSEAEVQAVSTTVKGSQTEPQDHIKEQFLLRSRHEPEPPGLMDFLRRVEDTVMNELIKNAKSHAFDGFHVNWEDHSQMVSCLHHLQHPSAQEQGLHVTAISWSCTGSVIACAYGRMDDGDWSTERSCVCTWNLDRRGLNPKRADLVIDVTTAVTAVSFHPTRPIKNISWPDGQVLLQVEWVPQQRRGELGVLSACSGGRVLLWMLDSDQGRLVLSAGYALVRQQVPHSSSAHSKARGSSNVGVTSLALSPWDSDTFLVGSEGGLLLKCSFSAQMAAAVPPNGESLPLRAPAVFSFRPRGGPVHSIHCSPFHRNLFLSVGTDGLAHLHSLLQASPLLSLRVADSYVFGVRWSPTRPLVFAAATGQGAVQIFDLGRRSLRPAATIEKSSAGQAASCLAFNGPYPHPLAFNGRYPHLLAFNGPYPHLLAFNGRYPHLLAVGSADGSVSIWHLSSDLTEQGHRGRESTTLEQLANEVAE